jgi:hypothetical protein
VVAVAAATATLGVVALTAAGALSGRPDAPGEAGRYWRFVVTTNTGAADSLAADAALDQA